MIKPLIILTLLFPLPHKIQKDVVHQDPEKKLQITSLESYYNFIRDTSGSDIEELIIEGSEITNLKGAFEFTSDSIYLKIAKLAKLKKLTITRCRLTFIHPSIRRLKKLEFLDLSGNKLTNCDSLLRDMPNLREIRFHWNFITDLEGLLMGIDSNNTLEFITFSHNCIDSIPESICRLKALSVIHLSNIGISDLLRPPKNNITHIPCCLSDYDRFTLNIVNNNVSMIDSCFCKPHEKWYEIDARFNKNLQVPDCFRDTQFLRISKITIEKH